MTPQIRYARSADGVHIAYQVHGDGPIDLLVVLGWTTNIEALWEEPSMARFLNRLASSSRLILFDKRGVGCRTGFRSHNSRAWRHGWTTSVP